MKPGDLALVRVDLMEWGARVEALEGGSYVQVLFWRSIPGHFADRVYRAPAPLVRPMPEDHPLRSAIDRRLPASAAPAAPLEDVATTRTPTAPGRAERRTAASSSRPA